MTTLQNVDPMTVYLLIEGEEPVAVPGIVDFNLTVQNPEVNDERDDGRRVNPRRTQQLRRRRRANAGDLSLTLDYDPCDWCTKSCWRPARTTCGSRCASRCGTPPVGR